MALLLRIALTRPGAERLLEARLMPSLAKGEFLDSRPDSDQAFTGKYAILVNGQKADALGQIKMRSFHQQFSDITNYLFLLCNWLMLC